MAKQSVFQRGWAQFFNGAGRVPQPDAGNEGNAPGLPPVQTGTYEFIQSFAFQGNGHWATDISPVPPGYQNWGQFAVMGGDPSGFFGGGFSQDPQVVLSQENDLYFDTSTGLYYDLGDQS